MDLYLSYHLFMCLACYHLEMQGCMWDENVCVGCMHRWHDLLLQFFFEGMGSFIHNTSVYGVTYDQIIQSFRYMTKPGCTYPLRVLPSWALSDSRKWDYASRWQPPADPQRKTLPLPPRYSDSFELILRRRLPPRQDGCRVGKPTQALLKLFKLPLHWSLSNLHRTCSRLGRSGDHASSDVKMIRGSGGAGNREIGGLTNAHTCFFTRLQPKLTTVKVH
jgi:hypothetical protein